MTIPYRIERTKNRHSRAVILHDTVVIRLARRLSQWEEQRHIETLLQRMTKLVVRERTRIPIDPYLSITDEERQDAIDLTHRINDATLRVRIGKVRLRAMRTQWGSCSHRGDITLNTALLQLPRHLLEYVIAHELAHRIVPGHTRKFWNVVASAFPEVDRARRELRSFRLSATTLPTDTPATPR